MEIQYAGFWRRSAAALADGMLLGLIYLVIILAISGPTLHFSDSFYVIAIATFLSGIADVVFLVFLPFLIIFGPAGSLGGMNGFSWATFASDICWSMGSVVINWLYHALLESSAKRATLGKMLLKIQVTDIEGHRISFWRATVRHFSKILSSFILCIGYMMAGWTTKKQAMHDKIAGCMVVRDVR